METAEFLPCPRCGHKPEIQKIYGSMRWKSSCLEQTKCGCLGMGNVGRLLDKHWGKESVIGQWNYRCGWLARDVQKEAKRLLENLISFREGQADYKEYYIRHHVRWYEAGMHNDDWDLENLEKAFSELEPDDDPI